MNKQKADQIITEYLTKIYGFAVKKSFCYDEAEELSAEIVKEVYISLLKSEDISNIDGYIWRISQNMYSKLVARNKRTEVPIDDCEIPYEDEYADDSREEELLRLRREITFLTKTRREIVYSYYFENKSILGISKEMNIPEGTVKWHLSKARNELKEGITMDRKIGKLGMNPVKAVSIGHSGHTGNNDGPEYYIRDLIDLNIIYSVYHTPRTKQEISEELGITLVFIEDKIDMLEKNGFLVREAGGRYTTYVYFNPETYSNEGSDKSLKKSMEVAEMLINDYVPLVREAVRDIDDIYIPGGNRELFEAAAIYIGILQKCGLHADRDISKYIAKTEAGGEFITHVQISSEPVDPEYKSEFTDNYWSCGPMTRGSEKYNSVYAWTVDNKFTSRTGTWMNNLTEDYDYVYEIISGMIQPDIVNSQKFSRLREKQFITDDGKINIMIKKGSFDSFISKLPELPQDIRKKYADYALEDAMNSAKSFPTQMRDYVIKHSVSNFIGNSTAIMVMDILYSNGTFRPLTENEQVTSNLIMFCDKLPE